MADGHFAYRRKTDQIAEEAALDGIYVLRTSVAAERLAAPDVVRAYKQLKEVERDFRALKGPELEIRPIHHRLEHRVRAHVFLCMLALYVEWHLRQTWRELTFHDEQRPHQADPVAKATRSPAAQRKAATKTTSTGQPAHTLRDLLAELATQTRNTVRVADSPATFTKLTQATPLQARALQLADAIRHADGIDWITALKAPQVKRLTRTGAFQPSLFDALNLA
ncbi:MAG: transposase, partial [Actinobacteria bacterium]|nr:transposase [Actinomycetota bacterium]